MADILTVTQAAAALGASPDTVRRLIAAGRLRAQRCGALYAVDAASVQRERRLRLVRAAHERARAKSPCHRSADVLK